MFQSFEPTSDRGFAARHLPLLRAELTRQGLDGILIPHDDEYLNEYLPDYAERLQWVSGFSGSAGFAIVLTERAAIFSDGRYTLQLPEQVDSDYFSLHNTADQTPPEWLMQNAAKGARIGYDPMLLSKNGLAAFDACVQERGIDLVATPKNPIDEAWADQPEPPCTAIQPHAAHLAGESSKEKRERLAKALSERSIDAALITAPHSLAWLFNIRGGDVHATPIPLGRAILFADGTASLFVDPKKVEPPLLDHLGNSVNVRPETDINAALTELGGKSTRLLIDPALAPIHYETVARQSGASVVLGADPCALPRATKNSAELDGAREAHRRDAVAVCKFLHWLSDRVEASGANEDIGISEIDAAQQLEAFRLETGQLKDISFDTISGAGEHGAIAHYRVTTPTNVPLKRNTLFLIDSGGQYNDGTTDITRTMSIGTPTDEMRRHYTLVLKGHIALARARFPKGTTGHQLDILARAPLWAEGLDYDHGTGHGVGSFLGVHEGPQNISKKPIRQPLLPGMICSNEPGFYKAGEYGIRIENLVIVTPYTPIDGGDREMMGFETITLAPLERELINKDLLSADEIEWVNTYHTNVFEQLSGALDAPVKTWLQTRTASL